MARLPPGWPRGWPISRTLQIYRGISAHNTDPDPDQLHYAIGDDDGSESAHTLGTEDTARTFTKGGDVDYILRILINNAVNSDQNETHVYKVQTRLNAGSWGDMAAATHVNEFDSANLTHGNDSTSRLTAGQEEFVTNNQGVIDNADEQNASFSWTDQGHMELVLPVRVIDAQVSASDTIEFRVVHGAGSAQAEGTLITYTVTPTIDVVAAPRDPVKRHPNTLSYLRY